MFTQHIHSKSLVKRQNLTCVNLERNLTTRDGRTYAGAMAKRKPRSGTLEQVFRKYPGTLTELAGELGVTVSALSRWTTIPILRVLELERLTGVSRYKLRPDVYGSSARAPKKSRARLAEAA